MTEETTTVTTTDGATEAPQPANKIIQVTGPETTAANKAAEEAAAAAAKAKETAEPEVKVEKVPDWVQKKWDASEFEKREAKREAKRVADENKVLQASLEALRKGGAKTEDGVAVGADTVPKAEFDRRVAEEAEKRAREDAARQSEAAAERQFDTDSNAAYEAGKKAYGDEFDHALKNFGNVGGNREILEVAYATDAPEKVLFELGRDPARAQTILAMSPAKMAVEFAKLALKPAPAGDKKVSGAPPPSKPLGGTAQVSGEPRDEDPDDEWFAKRRAEKARRAAGR